MGRDDARSGFKSEIALCANLLLHEPREATRAVAAHLPCAAIAVVKFPRPTGLAGRARPQDNHAVRSDASMPVTEPDDLPCAAIAVVKFPRPTGLAGRARPQDN